MCVFSAYFDCLSLYFTLAGADRPLRVHGEPPGGAERPKPASGGDGAAGSGAGEESEGLQGRWAASLLPSAELPPSRVAAGVTDSSQTVSCVVPEKEEERMLLEWFGLHHARHVLVRRDAELCHL